MIKAALIIDGNSVSRWQHEALQIASDLLEIKVVLACQNTKAANNYFKHFFYYVLNYFSLKNHLTRRMKFILSSKKMIKFDSIYEGGWQSLPEHVHDELNICDVDVVVKFGMNLLRIDNKNRNLKILSYHHGDPSKFRGRPAGFYELLMGERSIGTVVQEISNKLDAGKVWAICHSKVYRHSYKKTAINFYSNSKFLLRKALLNIENNTPVNITSDGGNYKLPSNFLVVRFCALLFLRILNRFIYGAFYEKRWNIAVFNDQDMHRGGGIRFD